MQIMYSVLNKISFKIPYKVLGATEWIRDKIQKANTTLTYIQEMEDQHHQQNNLTKTTIIPPSLPHVVIFPLPTQGPVNCMLKLAEFLLTLSQSTISITFVTTDFIHRRLALYSSSAARLTHSGPHFRFETVPDVVGPDEDPRRPRPIVDVTIFLEDQAKAEGSRLREVLAYGSAEPQLKKPVTCIIADGFFGCMVDVAVELKVPLVYFETVSPSGLWTYLCVPKHASSW